MRFVREELRLFDFDPYEMRGHHFFQGILDYRDTILARNLHRILPEGEWACRLCGSTHGKPLLE